MLLYRLKSNKTIYLFMLVYFLFHFSEGSFLTYFQLYLNYLNWNNAQIGALLAFVTVVSMCFQPFWGRVCDSASSKNRVLKFLLFTSSVVFVTIPFFYAAVWIIIMAVFYNVFRLPGTGILDTVTLEYASENRVKFGSIRIFASIGFATMSLVGGWMLARDIYYIFWVQAAATFLAILGINFLPTVKGHLTQRKNSSYFALFEIKNLRFFMIISTIFLAATGFGLSFYGIYFVTELQGGAEMLGIILALATFSEMPFVFMIDVLIKKLTVGKILAIACALGSLRWILTALVTNVTGHLFIQLLHGFNAGILNLTMVMYINRNTPPELKASGQTFYWLAHAFAMRVLGAFVLGAVSNFFELRQMYLAVGVALALTSLAAFAWIRVKKII